MIPRQLELYGHLVQVREFAERCALELLRPEPSLVALAAHCDVMHEHLQKAAAALAHSAHESSV